MHLTKSNSRVYPSVRSARQINDHSRRALIALLSVPTLRSIAIVIGLLVMMWPVLTKVQYERLPSLALERKLWYQIGISLILNWIIGELPTLILQ